MTLEDDKVKRGRGRPKEDSTHCHNIRARFDDEELKKLERIVDATGDNKSDILRIGMRGYYMHLVEKGVIKDE